MDTLHSVLLAGAIGALSLGVVVFALRRWTTFHSERNWRKLLAVAALGLDLAAAFIHFLHTHGPAGPAAMSFPGFLRDHPAFAIVALLAVALFFTAGRPRPRL